jgi:hypothetical protein
MKYEYMIHSDREDVFRKMFRVSELSHVVTPVHHDGCNARDHILDLVVYAIYQSEILVNSEPLMMKLLILKLGKSAVLSHD